MASLGVKKRKIGEWAAIELDMLKWAESRTPRINRRTDQQCRRRFALLEPALWNKHVEVRTTPGK